MQFNQDAAYRPLSYVDKLWIWYGKNLYSPVRTHYHLHNLHLFGTRRDVTLWLSVLTESEEVSKNKTVNKTNFVTFTHLHFVL